LTGLAVNKLDVLDTFAEIPVCSDYGWTAEPHDSMPAEYERAGRVEAGYEVLPGGAVPVRPSGGLADLRPPAATWIACRISLALRFAM